MGPVTRDAPPRTAALVAGYGQSAGPFHELAPRLQATLVATFGADFTPRPPATVHTTLIGLDPCAPVPKRGEAERLRDSSTVDVPGLCGAATDAVRGEPLRLRFGFPDADLLVHSRGERLHHRSLVVDPRRRQVVLLGWPVDRSGSPTLRLDRLRHDLEAYGTRHRYREDGRWQDPDAHLVLGELDLVPHDVEQRLAGVRAWLAAAPWTTEVGPDDLAVVVYDDPRLPPESTVRLAAADLVRQSQARPASGSTSGM